MSLHAKDYFEIGSDILAAIGSVAAIVPVYKLFSIKSIVHAEKTRIRLAAQNSGASVEDLLTELEEAEKTLDHFQPSDFTWFKVGAWMVVLSYLLKFAYHIASR